MNQENVYNPNHWVVFYDPTYPQSCTEATLRVLVPGSFQSVDVTQLAERLAGECSLLVSFHGPYFPKACWPALISFLQRGGNLAIFGGMPFARPLDSNGYIEPEQDVYTRQLGLGPFFQTSTLTPLAQLELVAADNALFLQDCPLNLPLEGPGTFWAFQPMLTQISDYPDEMGS